MWDVDGVTKNLTTLDDMSKITSAMISATSPTTTEINRASSHSEPSWITEGDLIRGISSADGNTTTFVDNNYLGIYLGKCTNNQGNTFYGIQIKNKVADANIGTAGGDPPINYNMDFYLGVILDRDNERAYLMYCWDKYNSGSNNYYRVYIVTAMYNGTDLLWETFKNGYQPKITSNGGGATHIAKRTGQLKDLSSYTSDILLVSGGGGGGLIVGEDAYAGDDAGGISGSGSNSGNQSSGYAFGQGESGTNVSGGGAGLYGGYKSSVG